MQLLFALTQDQTVRVNAIVRRVFEENRDKPDPETFRPATGLRRIAPHYAGNLIGWITNLEGIDRDMLLSASSPSANVWVDYRGKRSSLHNTKTLEVLKEIAGGDLGTLSVSCYSDVAKHLKWYEENPSDPKSDRRAFP